MLKQDFLRIVKHGRGSFRVSGGGVAWYFMG
jgi:hypothetical protein